VTLAVTCIAGDRVRGLLTDKFNRCGCLRKETRTGKGRTPVFKKTATTTLWKCRGVEGTKIFVSLRSGMEAAGERKRQNPVIKGNQRDSLGGGGFTSHSLGGELPERGNHSRRCCQKY